jgi:hypothetical protein
MNEKETAGDKEPHRKEKPHKKTSNLFQRRIF